jgi:4-hydroxy-4-methyl-2-oxoglutarate aldolase
MPSHEDVVARLARLDSCAVSDALDKLGLRGTVTGLAPLSSQRRVAGRVHTVKLIAAAKAPPRSGPPRHLGCAAIEACASGEVIVVEQRSGVDAGSWGGILSLGAKLHGVAGVIADGPVRDVDEARQMDFPVFARSATARTARARVAEEATDVPVEIGDVTVRPGDFVIADATSVVFVSAAEIARVLDVAEDIAAREAHMAAELRAGKPIGEVMGANYEHMLKKEER